MAFAAGEARRLLVVGTGLIGTSVALAARAAGYEVWIDDVDAARVRMAESVGAGRPWRETGSAPVGVDLAVVAAPPAAVAAVAHALRAEGVAPIITHVASVQDSPQREIEALDPQWSGFVGSHPIAGRERSGPHHASVDLFAQRPWIVCPTDFSSPEAVATVSALVEACGAVVAVMPAAEHDVLLAKLSHVPQLLASALAGSLLGLERADAALAGTGLRDTSRLADSDAGLWAEVVAANPLAVADALRTVLSPLEDLVGVLEHSDQATSRAAVRALVDQGRQGRRLLAGKHGQAAVRWATVTVVVPDEPRGLARLFDAAATAQVNVEDVRIDHSPGQPLGLVELDVAPNAAAHLERELESHGWAASTSLPASD